MRACVRNVLTYAGVVLVLPPRLVGPEVYDMLSKYDLIGVGVMLSPNPAGQVRFGCMFASVALEHSLFVFPHSFRAGVCQRYGASWLAWEPCGAAGAAGDTGC